MDSQAATLVFGYERDELIGQKVTILMPSDLRQRHDNFVKSHLDTGITRIIGLTQGRKVVGMHKNGKELQLILNINKSSEADGSLYFTAVFQVLMLSAKH